MKLLNASLEQTIELYIQGKTDLRGGAALAGVSYNRFLHEVQQRNIIILEEEGFLDRLYFLADTFNDQVLQSVVLKAIKQTNP